MTIFIESPRFPEVVSAWAQGGRQFQTIIVQTYGGAEYRQAPWLYGLGRWQWNDANMSLRPLSNFSYVSILNLWQATYGQLGGFRFKAPLDNNDGGGGVLGTTGLAVASTTVYQMFKNYTFGSQVGQGIIVKPIASVVTGTNDKLIQIFNNGVLQSSPSQYTLDTTTGIVTFVSQPTVGHALTWTGSFDMPCRFDGDFPQMGLTDDGCLTDWQNLVTVELRNP